MTPTLTRKIEWPDGATTSHSLSLTPEIVAQARRANEAGGIDLLVEFDNGPTCDCCDKPKHVRLPFVVAQILEHAPQEA